MLTKVWSVFEKHLRVRGAYIVLTPRGATQHIIRTRHIAMCVLPVNSRLFSGGGWIAGTGRRANDGARRGGSRATLCRDLPAVCPGRGDKGEAVTDFEAAGTYESPGEIDALEPDTSGIAPRRRSRAGNTYLSSQVEGEELRDAGERLLIARQRVSQRTACGNC